MLGPPPHLAGCTEEEDSERRVTGPSTPALSLQLGQGKDETHTHTPTHPRSASKDLDPRGLTGLVPSYTSMDWEPPRRRAGAGVACGARASTRAAMK